MHPEIPAEGQSLNDLFRGRENEVAEFRERMQGLMSEAGLPFGNRSMSYNSRMAQELGKWADTQPGGDVIHDRLYRAYFVDNVNLADLAALVSIAGAAGLDTTVARQVLEDRLFKDAVDADWTRARQSGVTGVPTFTANDLMVVGCQPYEVLEQFVAHLREQQSGD